MGYRFFILSYLVALLGMGEAAEPIRDHVWKAKSGHDVQAVATKVENGMVFLEKENGAVIQVPLTKLIESDQELLREHFEIAEEEVKVAPRAAGSGALQATGLPLPLGELVESVDTGKGATYHLYLPKSLKQDRKAPLLFYTNAGGGRVNLIKELIDISETFGWIMAISVESKNNAGLRKNRASCQNSLDHILSTLPVDKKRIHYTGKSGGAAEAFRNTTLYIAFGVLPDIGYIPGASGEQTKVVYACSGGWDYNRYLSAYAASKYKKNGFHRMNRKGHSKVPNSHREDGIFWMHCKFLAENKKKHEQEVKDFELAALDWIDGIKEKSPGRAYLNAMVLRDVYELSGVNEPAFKQLVEQLSKEPKNVLFYEAVMAIDEFSDKYFAMLGKTGGSLEKHDCPPSALSAIQELEGLYGQLPEIAEILAAMKKPTDQF